MLLFFISVLRQGILRHALESPGAGPLYHTLFAFEKIEGPSPGKNDGNIDHSREFPVRPRGRGEAARGEYEKRSTKDFRKPYSTDQYVCKQQNAYIFICVQLCSKKLHSYLVHSTERPGPLVAALLQL